MTYGAVETLTYDPIPTIIQEEKPKLSLPKTLPREELVQAIAWILTDVMKSKCKDYVDESEISTKSIFHAKSAPSISIQDYVARFSHYSKCEDDALIYALIYLDRIGEKLSDFSLDTFSVHKLLLISMAVACKFCDDSYFTNVYYANIGGISNEEFNTLEQEFLVNCLQFDMFVKVDVYNTYYSDIISYYKQQISQKAYLQ